MYVRFLYLHPSSRSSSRYVETTRLYLCQSQRGTSYASIGLKEAFRRGFFRPEIAYESIFYLSLTWCYSRTNNAGKTVDSLVKSIEQN